MILDVFLCSLSHENLNATGWQGIIEYILHYNSINAQCDFRTKSNQHGNERNSHVSTFS